MADARLQVLLDFKSKLAGLDKANRGIGSLTRNLVAVTGALAGVGAAAAGLRSGLAAITSFDSGMLRVKALTQGTADEVLKLKNQARDLGATTAYSAGQATQAMGFLAQAGFKVNEIHSSMPSVLNLAAAGQIELGEAADITAKVMRGYRLESHELANATDILTLAFTRENQNLSMVSSAFGKVAPVAASLKIPLAETTALVSKLASAGIQGEEGGTALRNVLLKLASQTPESAKVMKELGIEVADADGKFREITSIIDDFEEASKNAGEGSVKFADQMATVFGVRGFAPIQALIGQGTESIRKLREELDNAGGTSKRIADEMMSGIHGSFLRLKSVSESVALSIGQQGAAGAMQGFLDTSTGFMSVVDDIVNSSDKWKMIELSIVAAFEEGIKGAKAVVKSAFETATDDEGFWAPLTASISTISTDISNLLLEAMIAPISTVSTLWTWLFEQILEKASELQRTLATSPIKAISKLFGLVSKEMDFYSEKEGNGAKQGRTFFEIQVQQIETLITMVDAMKAVNNERLEDTLAIIGQADGTKKLNGELGEQATALERLTSLRAKARVEKSQREGVSDYESELGSGASVTSAGDSPEKKKDTTPAATLAPTFFEQVKAGTEDGLQTFVDQVGTVQDQVTGAVNGIANAFDTTLSGSIMGVLQGTQQWSDVLKNIGTNVIGVVIGEITKMATTWMVKKIAMFALGQKLKAADSATTAAKGATDAVAMAPAAMMASIASFGGAAVIGLALVVAAMAAFGGFAEGGYTGSGGKHQPAGIVHAGEFVLPKDVTERIGVGNLYNLMEDSRTGYAEGGAVAASGGESKSSRVIFLDDSRQAKRLAQDPDFETTIVDIARRNRAEIAI